ncbi:MAG: hypothetical protein ACC645_02255, partial [Pirellulales bacterium]
MIGEYGVGDLQVDAYGARGDLDWLVELGFGGQLQIVDCAFELQAQTEVRGSLDVRAGAVTQQGGVASAVRAGPLAGRRVKVTRDVAPGEAVQLAQEFLRFGVLDVPEAAIFKGVLFGRFEFSGR